MSPPGHRLGPLRERALFPSIVDRQVLPDHPGLAGPALPGRIANSLRRTIESGARSLARDERALFTGLVYGDDRAQSPLTADDFDAAGLTHLLAVSGQNVR